MVDAYKDVIIKIRKDLEEQYNLKELVPELARLKAQRDRLREAFREDQSHVWGRERSGEEIEEWLSSILKPGDMTDD